MSILPRLSIATKLYAIFALLATATVVLALVAVVNARHHSALTQEFEAASQGAQNVERLNGLIYAVAMESRGIYMSADADAASAIRRRPASGSTTGSATSSPNGSGWCCRRTPTQFEAFAERDQAVPGIPPRAGAPRRSRAASRPPANGATTTPIARSRERAEQGPRSVRPALFAPRQARLRQDRPRHRDHRLDHERAERDRGAAGGGGRVHHLAQRGAPAGARSPASPKRSPRAPPSPFPTARAATRSARCRARSRCSSTPCTTTRSSTQGGRRRRGAHAPPGEGRGRDRAASPPRSRPASPSSARSAIRCWRRRRDLAGAADRAAQRTAGATTGVRGGLEQRARHRLGRRRAGRLGHGDRPPGRRSPTPSPRRRSARPSAPTPRSRSSTKPPSASATWSGSSPTSPSRPICWRSTPPSKRRAPARPAAALPWWPARSRRWPGRPRKATEDIAAQIADMQHATQRSIAAIGAIERTIRDIGAISGAIAAAVTEQGAATQEIARSVEIAAKRTNETAEEVSRVGDATENTRASVDHGEVGGRRARRGGRPHPRPGRCVLRAAARRVSPVALTCASNAAGMWRGILPGATSTASNRMSLVTSSGCCDSQNSAAATIRRLLRSVTASAASSSVLRALTSTNTSTLRRPRDDVDLADRRAKAPRHDAIALGDQERGGAAFRRQADPERRDALGPRRGLRRCR